MESITEMNDDAATMIEQGFYVDALHMLDEAMETLNKVTSSSSDEAKDDCDDSPRRQNGRRGSVSSSSSTPPLKNSSSSQHCTCSAIGNGDALNSNNKNKNNSEYEQEDFIYRSPIHISAMETEGQHDNAMTMGVILIFNMGLAYHLKGFYQQQNSNTNKSTSSFRHALKLYKLCFSLVSSSGCINGTDDETQPDQILSMTHILALVNNCGQLYKELNRASKAKRFFQHMLTTLMALMESGEADGVDQLEGFMWNVSRLILVDRAMAAAA